IIATLHSSWLIVIAMMKELIINSDNILIHQGVIKLADFEKKIDNTSQQFTLNEKSDLCNVGVLLWELSNGRPPFHVKNEVYDIDLVIEISQ
ncbi:3359_t:CDS:2, partial [Funneliformis geosporum]